jgi:TRAP-type C4-dicarboxylate transport system substrate-binding protein
MRKIYLLLLVLALIVPAAAFGQKKVTIKLASLVPEQTPWGDALKRMSAEWAKATNGEVEMIIYHNGVVGSEEDVLRKLKGNQIQAAVFTSLGISLVTPEIMTLSAPFFIKTDDELNVVLEALKSDLEKKIVDKGFFPIAWAQSGWIKVFSKTPVFMPADLKKLKIGTAEETPALTQAFKSMGYQMIPVGSNDFLVALNSNKIEAFYTSPIAAAGNQFFGITKNMASLNIAPFMGGILLNRTAWRAIPEKYKPKLLEISKNIEEEITRSVSKLETEAVQTMTRYGLKVNQVTADQEKLWYADVEKAMPSLLKSTFDNDLYTKIGAILKAYRRVP